MHSQKLHVLLFEKETKYRADANDLMDVQAQGHKK